MLPSGTSKIGQFEYDIGLNGSPRTVAELNDLPVKADRNNTIYVHDVANVRDGFSPQTNIVRRDGQRSALLTIMKIGTASTLDIVSQVPAMLPANRGDASAVAEDGTNFGSVVVRARGRERRGPGGNHRGFVLRR